MDRQPDKSGEAGAGGSMKVVSPDLLRVALAAYALHLDRRAQALGPRPSSPWGKAARLAQLRGPR